MRMSLLTRELPIETLAPVGAGDVDVRGICFDSRRVCEGDLFVAWKGDHSDGLDHLPEVIEAGAVAVLASSTVALESRPEASVAWWSCDEPRRMLGPLAARLYRHPDRELHSNRWPDRYCRSSRGDSFQQLSQTDRISALIDVETGAATGAASSMRGRWSRKGRPGKFSAIRAIPIRLD